MTTVEAPVLRTFTIVVLATATIAMLMLSMLTNATFGYRFGSTAVTAGAFAAANVVADVWKGLGLIVVAGLVRHRHYLIALLLAVLWIVALAFGVASSMGLYVQDRTALIGGRETLSATLRGVEQEIVEEEARLRNLGVASDVTQIEAAIEAIFSKPITVADRVRGTVGTLSARCVKVDARTASECHQIAAFRADLAGAAERQRREDRLTVLRQQHRALRERGAGDASDPVAELFSWMSRGLLSVRDVGFGFPVAFALLIEFVSSFGPIGIVTYAAATRTAPGTDAMATPASPAALRQDVPRIEHRSVGSVVDFMAEATQPASEATAVGSEQLHEAYERWCSRHAQVARPLETFVEEFDRLRELPALRGKIRKFGMRYFGITLVALQRGSERGRP